MSIEADIQDKAISLLATDAASSGATLYSAGQVIEDEMEPVILVTCTGKQNICGPLWNVDLLLMANVANAPDPTKSLLSTLEGVISDFIDDIIATPSSLNPSAGGAYSVDGVDASIPQPKLDIGQMFTTRVKAVRLFLSIP